MIYRASFCICLRKTLPSLQSKRTFIESTCSYISCNFSHYIEARPGATDAQILITLSILLRSTQNFDKVSETNKPILMNFLPNIIYNYRYSAYQELFEILILTVFFFLQKTVKKTRLFLYSENVRHFVIFAEIKNRMICAIAINILNLKPFNFFLLDNSSPRFHKQRTPIYFLRTYDSPPLSSFYLCIVRVYLLSLKIFT